LFIYLFQLQLIALPHSHFFWLLRFACFASAVGIYLWDLFYFLFLLHEGERRVATRGLL
ncbi:unnamed protein product, partial [Prunus brigantina]